MQDFQYAAPATLSDAVALLAEWGDRAKILAGGTDILVQLRERMRDELRAIQLRLGITSLYVTHDQSEAMAISDRVVVMRGGVIEQDDSPLNVYSRPGTGFVAEFMGKANILAGKVEAVDEATVRVRITSTVAFTLPPGSRAFKVGEAVRCVVRPEHIRVDADGTMEAKVRRVVMTRAPRPDRGNLGVIRDPVRLPQLTAASSG